MIEETTTVINYLYIYTLSIKYDPDFDITQHKIKTPVVTERVTDLTLFLSSNYAAGQAVPRWHVTNSSVTIRVSTASAHSSQMSTVLLFSHTFMPRSRL